MRRFEINRKSAAHGAPARKIRERYQHVATLNGLAKNFCYIV